MLNITIPNTAVESLPVILLQMLIFLRIMQFSYENSLSGETWQLKIHHVTAAICCYCFTKYSRLVRDLLSKLKVESNFGKYRRLDLQSHNVLFVPLLIIISHIKMILRELYFYFLPLDGHWEIKWVGKSHHLEEVVFSLGFFVFVIISSSKFCKRIFTQYAIAHARNC